MLDCPVIARFIRLLPQGWTNHIALRFDVIGCQAVTGTPSLHQFGSVSHKCAFLSQCDRESHDQLVHLRSLIRALAASLIQSYMTQSLQGR